MCFSARNTFLIITAIVAINTVMWLDSLDGYLGARYHVQLSQYLPATVFAPSRYVASLLQGSPAEDVAADEAPSSASMQEPGHSDASSAGKSSAPAASAQSAVSGSEPAAEQSGVEPEHPRVLFAGDSMMQGLAPFVIASLKKTYPDGYFSDQSKQSTGLTVKRYFDWPTKIRDEVLKQNFDTLVIFLGPNDPWDIYEDGKRYIFPSDNWIEKYRSRVAEVLEFSKEHKVTVVWVGLPNMRDDRVKQGAIVENEVFREETKKFGYDYFPTEPIIGSLDEPFHKHIDDPEKGKVAIRADDGIHFTPTGLRMISRDLVELLKTRLH